MSGLTSVKASALLPGRAQWRWALLVLILAWVIFNLVRLTMIWTRSEPQPSTTQVSELASSPSTTPAITQSQLAALTLFGDAASDAAAVFLPTTNSAYQDAAETQLDLKLTGIAFSNKEAEASAVISYRNKSDQYHIKDNLPAGQNIYLEAILVDRVIINNRGVSESLWLYQDGEYDNLAVASSGNTSKSSEVVDLRQNASARSIASDLRETLLNQPQQLVGAVQITPFQEDGELKGYRVNPRGDESRFAALGFEPNDVITSVNGLQLSEFKNVMQLYQQLGSTEQASVTVLRDGQEIQLLMSLDAIE